MILPRSSATWMMERQRNGSNTTSTMKSSQLGHTYVWPKVTDFSAKVKEAFAFEDKKEDSVRKLETLKQGNRNAKEMTNEF